MARITIEEYEKITWKKLPLIKTIEEKIFWKEDKKNKWQDEKFNSNSCELNWIRFRSELEMKRYTFLQFMKKLWKLKDFSYTPKKFLLMDSINYPFLQERKLNKITYTPDFLIVTNKWSSIYEDTKSIETAKKESYKIKKRLFLEKYILWKNNIYFKEVFSFDDTYFFWL